MPNDFNLELSSRAMRKTTKYIERDFMKFIDKLHKMQKYVDTNGNMHNWSPRMSSTIKNYRRQGYNTSRVGVRTGSMMRSFNSKRTYTKKRGRIKVKNLKDYADYFNAGNDHMGARPLYGLTETKQKEYMDELSDNIAKDLGFSKN